jgi:NAD(P)-dependent dehydrogenase (short-subunit alcohol dehydrogenase family)
VHLDGQRIVVIGGSAGIGLAVAELALDLGADVFIGSHNEERLANAVAKSQGRLSSALIDVADDSSTKAFFDTCSGFDHLVFTAGDWSQRKATPGKSFDLKSAKAAFDIRFWGMLRTIDAALETLQSEGSIILTSGLLAHRPQRGQAISSAVTGAVEHLTQALALDLAPVRVNVVVPGFIATEVWSGLSAERIDDMANGTLLRRPGRPHEAAQAYIGLMLNGYMTGQSVIVDGGMALG